MYLTSVSCIS